MPEGRNGGALTTYFEAAEDTPLALCCKHHAILAVHVFSREWRWYPKAHASLALLLPRIVLSCEQFDIELGWLNHLNNGPGI